MVDYYFFIYIIYKKKKEIFLKYEVVLLADVVCVSK